MNFYWKFTSKYGIIFRASKFTLVQSMFSFAHYASLMRRFCAQWRACVRGRCLWKPRLYKSRLRENCARPMLGLIHWRTSDFTWRCDTRHLYATHKGYMCLMTQFRTLNARAMRIVGGTISWSWRLAIQMAIGGSFNGTRFRIQVSDRCSVQRREADCA